MGDIEVTEYYTQNDETKRITQETFTEEAKKTIKASEKEAQDTLAVAFVAQVAEDAAKLAAENPNQDPTADVNTDKLDNKNKNDKTDKTGKNNKDGKKTDKKGGMSAWVIISLCILGALLIAGAVWFFVFRTSEEDEEFNAEQEC